MSASLPDRPKSGSPPLPTYRLTGSQVEAVIRRAVELQAREAEGGAGAEGMTAEELVRISSELGLSPTHVQEALAEIEVAGEAVTEQGLMLRLWGPGKVSAARRITRPAEEVRRVLDEYLRGVEAMVVQRRIADLTVYEEGSGIGAAITRVAAKAGARHAPLHLKQVETAVRPIDDATCYVAIGADVASARAVAATMSAVGGGFGGAGAGLALATIFVPIAALAGIPILLAAHQASRSWYTGELKRFQVRLESLLDRLEHRELDPSPNRSVWRFNI